MGKARPAFSPFSLMSLLEQSSNLSLPGAESSAQRDNKETIVKADSAFERAAPLDAFKTFFFLCVSAETTSCSQTRQYAGARLTRCRSWSSLV